MEDSPVRKRKFIKESGDSNDSGNRENNIKKDSKHNRRGSDTDFSEIKIIQICKGNPGAISVVGNVYSAYPNISHIVFDKLIEFNFTGGDIWVLFKNKSENNIETFVNTVLEMKEKPEL